MSSSSAYFCGAILPVINMADEKEVFQRTPWGLIIMIVGFGTLMGVTSTLGGVTLLAQFLSSISNRYIAAPILSFTSSVMSIFSFALAGPIPTLIPTVATMSEAVGGAVKEIEMVAGICVGGFAASVSPLSLGGAILISAYNQIKNPDKKETNAVLDGMVEQYMAGYAQALDAIDEIPGIARRSAQVILAEIGLDMERFPSAAHLCSWAGVSPGNHQSAGKRKRGRTNKGNKTLKSMLAQCAKAAGKVKSSYFYAQYQRIAARRGKTAPFFTRISSSGTA